MLQAWLWRKLDRGWNPIKAKVQVKKEFRRVTGGRCIYGAVFLEAAPYENFKFLSEVEWPDSCNYEMSVLDGLLDVLLIENYRPVLGLKIILKGIQWHEIDSVAYGYYMAAREAAYEIMNSGNKQGNIDTFKVFGGTY